MNGKFGFLLNIEGNFWDLNFKQIKNQIWILKISNSQKFNLFEFPI